MSALLLAVVVTTFGFGNAVSAQEAPSTTDPTTTTDPTATTTAGSTRIVATVTVDDDRTPVEGVELVVSLDGAEICRSTSDADGVAAVVVPGAGKYGVALDRATFPDDVVIAEGAPAELSPRVRDGSDRSVIFRLESKGSTTERSGSSTTERGASLLASGIRLGLVIRSE